MTSSAGLPMATLTLPAALTEIEVTPSSEVVSLASWLLTIVLVVSRVSTDTAARTIAAITIMGLRMEGFPFRRLGAPCGRDQASTTTIWPNMIGCDGQK